MGPRDNRVLTASRPWSPDHQTSAGHWCQQQHTFWWRAWRLSQCRQCDNPTRIDYNHYARVQSRLSQTLDPSPRWRAYKKRQTPRVSTAGTVNPHFSRRETKQKKLAIVLTTVLFVRVQHALLIFCCSCSVFWKEAVTHKHNSKKNWEIFSNMYFTTTQATTPAT